MSVAVLLPVEVGANLTLREYEDERETLNEVERGLNMLAFAPVTTTLLTARVAVPLFETVIVFVLELPLLTLPKPTEEVVYMSGTLVDCCRLNVAVQDLLAFMDTTPSEQSELPLHPANADPLAAEAVRVT